MQRSHGLTFLLSDCIPLPDRLFQGHAFVDSDYVFGQDGALNYEAYRGTPVGPGEDGCYVTMARENDKYTIGVDHNGSKKLFYYEQGVRWCISNSLVLLTEHLGERGIPLTVNFPNLAAFKAPGTFASQQATTTTIFNEIKLLPTSWTLSVTNEGLQIHKRWPAKATAVTSYRRALDDFITTWISRLRTLLRDERTWLNVDLSGGVDSRTMFALVAAARTEERDQRAQGQVYLRSSTAPGQVDDWNAATEIADHYKWELNGSMVGRPALPRLTSEERYIGWRDLSLGVYSSIYFPDRRANSMVIDLHGGGGRHRPSYPACAMEGQLRSIRDIHPEYLSQAWKRQVISETEILTQSWPWARPLDSHYHEFRNRFHAGLNPQYRTVFAPLGSWLVDSMSSHPAKVSTGQIVFDVMESLIPGLKDFAYSTIDRRPSAENLANMTLSTGVEKSVPGEIFGMEEPSHVDPRRDPGAHIELMAKELESIESDLVSEFLGEEIVENSHAAMTDALNAGRFAHAGGGKDVSRVLATAFAFSTAKYS